jgi:hypothetical protein
VAWSGGSEPGKEEKASDITAEFPKPRRDEIVRAADVVVTMGCGDACQLYRSRSPRSCGGDRADRSCS